VRAWRDDVNPGTSVLRGVTAVVLAGFARFIVSVARCWKLAAFDDTERMAKRWRSDGFWIRRSRGESAWRGAC
jgi:hypothetical protein